MHMSLHKNNTYCFKFYRSISRKSNYSHFCLRDCRKMHRSHFGCPTIRLFACATENDNTHMYILTSDKLNGSVMPTRRELKKNLSSETCFGASCVNSATKSIHIQCFISSTLMYNTLPFAMNCENSNSLSQKYSWCLNRLIDERQCSHQLHTKINDMFHCSMVFCTKRIAVKILTETVNTFANGLCSTLH